MSSEYIISREEWNLRPFYAFSPETDCWNLALYNYKETKTYAYTFGSSRGTLSRFRCWTNGFSETNWSELYYRSFRFPACIHRSSRGIYEVSWIQGKIINKRILILYFQVRVMSGSLNLQPHDRTSGKSSIRSLVLVKIHANLLLEYYSSGSKSRAVVSTSVVIHHRPRLPHRPPQDPWLGQAMLLIIQQPPYAKKTRRLPLWHWRTWIFLEYLPMSRAKREQDCSSLFLVGSLLISLISPDD